ncbi:hypothetical protein ABCR88_03815 [Pseudomonas sp. W17]|uniref:Uncharacterized protein n=1 Tax=Pseudomonas sp. W17 TaxID=3144407 RepID=A0AAU7WX24_9PSED|nr:hypothetical protein [Pseudomonas protegens]WRV92368.1 hypothetical protein VP719_04845 [Pseudomonas protegens]
MKKLSRRGSLTLGAVVLGASLWPASQWWEKGLATARGAPRISPNGCYRVQVFRPFWVLPGRFHTQYHPDPEQAPNENPHWELPAFFRLYDQRNDQWLGDSQIYDLVVDGGPLQWGMKGDPRVSAAMIDIGPNAPDCIGDQPAKGR